MIKTAGKTYQINLEKVDKHKPFSLKVNDVLFKVQLGESVKRIITKTPTEPATRTKRRYGKAISEDAVVAPMAGKIVSVLVKEADHVKAGDIVCVLEAMKMENEIAVTEAGVIKEVKISKGMSVREGQAL